MKGKLLPLCVWMSFSLVAKVLKIYFCNSFNCQKFTRSSYNTYCMLMSLFLMDFIKSYLIHTKMNTADLALPLLTPNAVYHKEL